MSHVALATTSGCCCIVSGSSTNSSRVHRIRAVASEDYVGLEKVKLGASDLKVSMLGIGAWSWGDTSYWNNFEWDDRKMKAAKSALDSSIDNRISFFDTAEFSFGAIKSETLLGRFIKERKQKDPDMDVAVATKFAALPWRLVYESVISALKDSLSSLELPSVELYQLHWLRYIDGLEDAVKQGLVKAVGVSNYSGFQSKMAPKLLGITLIAYSPIAQGALTGKETPQNPPTGPRGRIYTPEFLTQLQPLINRQSYNKTPRQVVLNWLISQANAISIPGAKNSEQAIEFAGTLGWRLSGDEVGELRSLASQTKPVMGFPVGKL